jgi:hypothetical protein
MLLVTGTIAFNQIREQTAAVAAPFSIEVTGRLTQRTEVACV